MGIFQPGAVVFVIQADTIMHSNVEHCLGVMKLGIYLHYSVLCRQSLQLDFQIRLMSTGESRSYTLVLLCPIKVRPSQQPG